VGLGRIVALWTYSCGFASGYYDFGTIGEFSADSLIISEDACGIDYWTSGHTLASRASPVATTISAPLATGYYNSSSMNSMNATAAPTAAAC
jgi:hypothetical protein